jgi:hypothetical protein
MINYEGIVICGAGGSRTLVQTYSPKAFYMLIYALVCRDQARGVTNQLGPYPLLVQHSLTETMNAYSAIGLIQRQESQQTATQAAIMGANSMIRQPWRS